MNDQSTKDVVCGRDVRPDSPFSAVYGDRPFYFCSETCRESFIGDPLHFVDRSGAASSTEGSPLITAEGKEVPNKV